MSWRDSGRGGHANGISELKRMNVFRVDLLDLFSASLILQVAEVVIFSIVQPNDRDKLLRLRGHWIGGYG